MSVPAPAHASVRAPCLRARDVAVIRSGRWVAGRVRPGSHTSPRNEPACLGCPGLWNVVPGPEPAPVFAWPAEAFDALRSVTDSDPSAHGVKRKYRAWMARTFGAPALSSWRAPSPAAVAAVLAGEQLLVRRGITARRIRPHVDTHRLALRCEVIPSLPARLGSCRARWLERLRVATLQRHPCVRLEWARTDRGRTMIAETDLSGAPPSWVERLLVQALAEMRQGLAPLLEPFELLAGETDQDLQCLVIPNKKEKHDETTQ